MSIRRRAALALPLAALATPALGQAAFPNRPIRILLPWPAGGLVDGMLRAMADVASRDIGQPVLVENRAGSRGLLAAIHLTTQARPDGYTVAHHHLTVIRHPYLTKQPSWDPVTDFTYIIQQSGFVFGTVVRADSPWRDFKGLIDGAKRQPGRLTYATSGIATSNHLAAEDILAREGAEMTHVPFRGTSESVTALLARQIDSIWDSSTWRPQVENGDFRLLSVWTRERLRSFPDVPTLNDLGYGMSVTSPFGIAGPKGMDPEVTLKLHDILRRATLSDPVQAIMRRWEMPDEYLGPREYLAFAVERAAYERQMVTRLGLSID
jgi:tripartite-type tricarboxylate transporter receptor subunit TctC